MQQQEHIGIRLKDWITSKGTTALAFAELINVQRSALSHIFSGRNKPSVAILVKIKSAFPDMDLEWLITGVKPAKTNEVTTIQDVKIQDSAKNEFTDVNFSSDLSDNQDNKLTDTLKFKDKGESSKIIRIIEIYSDNSFKSYES